MAPRKRTIDSATSKGKVIATTGGTTSRPTSNQPRAEGTGSISLPEPSTSVRPSQLQENQLFQMLYEMKEQMKKRQQQSNREREQMALDPRTSSMSKRNWNNSINSFRLKSQPARTTPLEQRMIPRAKDLRVPIPLTSWSRGESSTTRRRDSTLSKEIQGCEFLRKFSTPIFDSYTRASDSV